MAEGVSRAQSRHFALRLSGRAISSSRASGMIAIHALTLHFRVYVGRRVFAISDCSLQ